MIKVTLGVATVAAMAAASLPAQAAQPASAAPIQSLIGLPADAAMTQPGAAAAAPELTLTPAERAALLPVKQAVDAGNWAGASALVPAARAAAASLNARYVLARLELDIAVATQNRVAQRQAIDAIISSRKASPEELVELNRQIAGITYDTGNLTSAEAALNRAVQIAPNDAESLSMLAQLNRNKNNATQALAYFQRALRSADLIGRQLPESRYRLALALAEQAGQRGVALEIARSFISAFPTPFNWRDVLIVFRTVGTVDPGQSLDAFRLQRAAGALAGERDYLALAQALDQAGHSAEAKAVMDEGVAKRMITASDAAPKALLATLGTRVTRERNGAAAVVTQARATTGTAAQARTAADTLLSLGRDAEAAELYRVALTRVGEDPELVNTRLGIALARAGNRAEAEAAFRAATGSRAELAALWQVWLARRPA
jgi:tetratricopeptide (TPR) repeat protein